MGFPSLLLVSSLAACSYEPIDAPIDPTQLQLLGPANGEFWLHLNADFAQALDSRDALLRVEVLNRSKDPVALDPVYLGQVEGETQASAHFSLPKAAFDDAPSAEAPYLLRLTEHAKDDSAHPLRRKPLLWPLKRTNLKPPKLDSSMPQLPLSTRLTTTDEIVSVKAGSYDDQLIVVWAVDDDGYPYKLEAALPGWEHPERREFRFPRENPSGPGLGDPAQPIASFWLFAAFDAQNKVVAASLYRRTRGDTDLQILATESQEDPVDGHTLNVYLSYSNLSDRLPALQSSKQESVRFYHQGRPRDEGFERIRLMRCMTSTTAPITTACPEMHAPSAKVSNNLRALRLTKTSTQTDKPVHLMFLSFGVLETRALLIELREALPGLMKMFRPFDRVGWLHGSPNGKLTMVLGAMTDGRIELVEPNKALSELPASDANLDGDEMTVQLDKFARSMLDLPKTAFSSDAVHNHLFVVQPGTLKSDDQLKALRPMFEAFKKSERIHVHLFSDACHESMQAKLGFEAAAFSRMTCQKYDQDDLGLESNDDPSRFQIGASVADELLQRTLPSATLRFHVKTATTGDRCASIIGPVWKFGLGAENTGRAHNKDGCFPYGLSIDTPADQPTLGFPRAEAFQSQQSLDAASNLHAPVHLFRK